MVSLFIFSTGQIALDSEPRGRRYTKNTGHDRNRLYSRAIHCLESRRTKPWCPVLVSRPSANHRNHWQEVLKICTNWEFWGLNNKTSTYCHCPLLLATGSCALALGRDTKPGHHALVHPDSWRQNLFFSQTVISYTHTSKTIDGPWIKTVPVVSRIFTYLLPRGSESRAIWPVGKMN